MENTQTNQQTKVEFSEKEKVAILEDIVKEAKDNEFLAFNYFELKAKFPKAIEKLKAFILKESKVDLNQSADEDMLEEICVGSLLYNGKLVLPKFFDENNIYTSVYPMIDDKKIHGFDGTIIAITPPGIENDTWFNHEDKRNIAEEGLYLECFDYMNKNL